MEAGSLHDTEAGTPQGGIASPVLANFALNGMQKMLTDLIPHGTGSRRRKAAKINFIRYADDFVITGATPELLRETVQPAVERFLAERGLTLSTEKTKITHIADGYDFLGFTIRRFGRQLLVRPSDASQRSLLKKVREVVRSMRTASQPALIDALNPILRGWANYHRHNAAKAIFSELDHRIWECLWRWARRRHPGKPKGWVNRRYYVTVGNQRWRFGCRSGDDFAILTKLDHTSIVRHTRVKGDMNPYDPAWRPYLEARTFKRMQVLLRKRQKHAVAHHKQKGYCPGCGQMLEENGWHLHHVVERRHGGGDEQSNLLLLHENCQLQHHHGRTLEEPVTYVAS